MQVYQLLCLDNQLTGVLEGLIGKIIIKKEAIKTKLSCLLVHVRCQAPKTLDPYIHTFPIMHLVASFTRAFVPPSNSPVYSAGFLLTCLSQRWEPLLNLPILHIYCFTLNFVNTHSLSSGARQNEIRAPVTSAGTEQKEHPTPTHISATSAN